MRSAITAFFLTFTIGVFGQLDYGKPSVWNLPHPLRDAFETQHTLAQYDIADAINPFYLRGDFDGDGIPDYALFVVNKKTKKRGIAILRSTAKAVEILGAGGTKLSVGSDKEPAFVEDFDWMDEWYVERKGNASTELGAEVAAKMRGEGLVVAKSESASSLIFWNGRGWVWVQMGD